MKIKNIYGKVIYKNETDSLIRCLEEVISGGANLYEADLRGAELYRANLRGAELYRANLYEADLYEADLRRANLRGANLYRANLYEADLRGADLRGAELYRANLYGADLRGADLRGANLRGANLRGANIDNKYLTTPLYMLLDQPGKIRAYKLVNSINHGPQYGGIEYRPGRTVCVDDFCSDENIECGAGINLATLDWCIREWRSGHKVLICEFAKKDIVAIPVGSDGKFRVKKCKVVRYVSLEKIGLAEGARDEK